MQLHERPIPIQYPCGSGSHQERSLDQCDGLQTKDGAQSSIWRPDAVARGHRNDEADRRHCAAARDRDPRPHHCRKKWACEFERTAADLGPCRDASAFTSSLALRGNCQQHRPVGPHRHDRKACTVSASAPARPGAPALSPAAEMASEEWAQSGALPGCSFPHSRLRRRTRFGVRSIFPLSEKSVVHSG